MSCVARILTVAVVSLTFAHAQTFTVLHSFTGGPDGKNPDTGVLDAAGNFYGTTQVGGSHSLGTVFKLAEKNSSWVLSVLYDFAGGNDGAAPRAGLAFGPDGSLYGATVNGGFTDCTAGCGTVYKLQPPLTFCHSVTCPWIETVLFRFAATDGAYPSSNVSFDPFGNMYGTTRGGGSSQNCSMYYGCGVVYELTPAGGQWDVSVLYSFNGAGDGEYPSAGVARDNSGDLFGTSAGPGNYGSVYELSPFGQGYNKAVIYQFQGMSDGYDPIGLIIDSAGNLYGEIGRASCRERV